jgi:hypothetical protein
VHLDSEKAVNRVLFEDNSSINDILDALDETSSQGSENNEGTSNSV